MLAKVVVAVAEYVVRTVQAVVQTIVIAVVEVAEVANTLVTHAGVQAGPVVFHAMGRPKATVTSVAALESHKRFRSLN